MKPLAIFGGTFDPVHIGHLTAAWEASELLDAEVWMLPSSHPPHRPPPCASASQRLAGLTAALQGQQRLRIDDRELRRAGPSYTVDTLRELRAEQGTRPLVWLLGEDAFASLPGWHQWRELFSLAHIGVLSRPGLAVVRGEALWREITERRVTEPADLKGRAAGAIIELKVTPLEVSATRIRELLASGRDPRYLLPAGLFADTALLAPYRR